MSESKIVRHEKLDIAAPKEYWEALGYEVTTWLETGESRPKRPMSWHNDALIIEAMHATGAHDEQVLAWAIAERSRRDEERNRTTAQERVAEALKALAGALRDSSQDAMLSHIIGCLDVETAETVQRQMVRR